MIIPLAKEARQQKQWREGSGKGGKQYGLCKIGRLGTHYQL